MVRFELIFVNVTSVSFFCMWMSTCWRDYLCFIVLPLFLCQISAHSFNKGLFLGSLFYSIGLFVYVVPTTTPAMHISLLPSHTCSFFSCAVSHSHDLPAVWGHELLFPLHKSETYVREWLYFPPKGFLFKTLFLIAM